MKTNFIIYLSLVVFILASCAAPPLELTSAKTVFPLPTLTISTQYSTITFTQPVPTATEIQLPLNNTNIDFEHCQTPDILLPISEAQGTNVDEITYRLVEMWLTFFNTPKTPNYCRIDGFHIDKVYSQKSIMYENMLPKGDFMRTVQFSIKLTQLPNSWIALQGEIDPQNWLHIGRNVAVFLTKKGYTFEFANP
jgi:hypothetical protein